MPSEHESKVRLCITNLACEFAETACARLLHRRFHVMRLSRPVPCKCCFACMCLSCTAGLSISAPCASVRDFQDSSGCSCLRLNMTWCCQVHTVNSIPCLEGAGASSGASSWCLALEGQSTGMCIHGWLSKLWSLFGSLL